MYLDPRRVLIPDANNRAALAVVRSLGRQGLEVITGRSGRWCLASASRFSKAVLEHPDPSREPERFADVVAAGVLDLGIGVVLPVADVPTSVVLSRRGSLPEEVRVLTPPEDALRIAHDKARLTDLARTLDVPVPEGVLVAGDSLPLDTVPRDLGFPLVVKPRRSRFVEEGRWVGASVAIARDAAELREILGRSKTLLMEGVLVQRRVPGEGRGVFLLARDGRLVCAFSHRRIREKPPWGGVSTLCEGVAPEPELLGHSERLIAALRWSGVAMVEFKWDPATRRSWLMEINGRFWGSTQLAVASGIDFPWLLYQQEILGLEVRAPKFREDVRLLWLLGDMDHFLIRLKRGGWRELRPALRDIARTRQHRTLNTDTLCADDPSPFFVELAQRLSRGEARRGRSASPGGRG